jgi:uncharacterized protein (TIGR04551 family)
MPSRCCLAAALVVLGASSAPAQSQPATPAAPPPPAAPEQASPPPATLPPTPEQPGAQPAPSQQQGSSKGKAGDEINLKEWESSGQDWMVEQPKVSLLELDGYLRMRGDLLRRLNFGNATATEQVNEQPVPRYVATDGKDANYGSTNMRLRIEPTINVTEDIHLVATVDVFDNLVMGSVPSSALSTGVPLNLLSTSQTTPRFNVNSLSDSIVVKRAYARINALNEKLELRFGRTPSAFGLGMFDNAGDCLDCDFGDVADRIALTFKIADHQFTPMFDWGSSGPVTLPFNGNQGVSSTGQALDAVPWDDSDQYSLRIQRLDAPTDIRNRVQQGEPVLNYGLWAIWRRQSDDLSPSYYTDNSANPGVVPAPSTGFDPTVFKQKRSGNVYTGDAYLRWYYKEIELAVEGALRFGSVSLPSVNDPNTTVSTNLLQAGGALEATWHLGGEYRGTVLALKGGAASGDRHGGFGALDAAGTQRGPGDNALDNFQFNPDYHVDLLLFRHIIGTVTDAWYVRPEVGYNFENNIGGRFWAVYSQAFEKSSTPNGKNPLGLELDAELAYGAESNPESGAFKGALMGGMLFPFNAFKNPTLNAGPSFAWTIEARLYVTF